MRVISMGKGVRGCGGGLGEAQAVALAIAEMLSPAITGTCLFDFIDTPRRIGGECLMFLG